MNEWNEMNESAMILRYQHLQTLFFSAKLYPDEAGTWLLQRSVIDKLQSVSFCVSWVVWSSDGVLDGTRVTSQAGNGRRELVTSLLMTNAAASAARQRYANRRTIRLQAYKAVTRDLFRGGGVLSIPFVPVFPPPFLTSSPFFLSFPTSNGSSTPG